MRNTGVAYLLWLTWLFGAAGVHRIYAGKYISGFLWLFTWGFFGIGQVVDLALIPDMVEEKNRKYSALNGYPYNTQNVPQVVIKLAEENNQKNNYQNTSRFEEQQMNISNLNLSKPPAQSDIQIILQLAKDSQEGISVADCVLATGKSIEEIKKLLTNLHAEGLLEIDNREITGAVVYKYM
ncbi:MAG: TM2 domain-containing protein [Xenococcaceae cyanobacterium]